MQRALSLIFMLAASMNAAHADVCLDNLDPPNVARIRITHTSDPSKFALQLCFMKAGEWLCGSGHMVDSAQIAQDKRSATWKSLGFGAAIPTGAASFFLGVGLGLSFVSGPGAVIGGALLLTGAVGTPVSLFETGKHLSERDRLAAIGKILADDTPGQCQNYGLFQFINLASVLDKTLDTHDLGYSFNPLTVEEEARIQKYVRDEKEHPLFHPEAPHSNETVAR